MRAAAPFRHRRRLRRLERDDAGVAAALAQRARHAAQHAAGADRAAERVDAAAGLLQQLAADAGVAVDRVLVVELIGPERVRLAASTAISVRNRSNSAGVTLPPSLGTIRSSAPNASIVSSFSSRERVGRERRRTGSPWRRRPWRATSPCCRR